MNTKNERIKQYAKQKEVCMWELAERFGVADNTFSRRLRVEFTPEETEQALRYIDEIAASRERK